MVQTIFSLNVPNWGDWRSSPMRCNPLKPRVGLNVSCIWMFLLLLGVRFFYICGQKELSQNIASKFLAKVTRKTLKSKTFLKWWTESLSVADLCLWNLCMSAYWNSEQSHVYLEEYLSLCKVCIENLFDIRNYYKRRSHCQVASLLRSSCVLLNTFLC